jgi:hypothetical protein
MVNFPAFVHHNSVDGALGCPRLETILCRLLKSAAGGKLWEARLALSRTFLTGAGSRWRPLDMALSVQPEPAVDRHDLSRIDQFGMAGAQPAPNPWASKRDVAPGAEAPAQTKTAPKRVNETASKELRCFREPIVVRGGQGG